MSNGQWKLVPVEPTQEMLDAGMNTPCVCSSCDDALDRPQDYRDVFKAMLAAAKEPK